MKRRRLLWALPLALALGLAACQPQARGLLTASAAASVTEGQRAQVAVTITNVHTEPIIPLTLSLYVHPDPTQYMVQRHTLGEVQFYKPLMATEVRHLQTLDCIQAEHVRDGDQWRRVPDSRFLHPRILLPGQSLTETFQFQAIESHRRLLRCDLYYVPLTSAPGRGRLFVRTKPEALDPDAERYTEVYTRVAEGTFGDPTPDPARYLFFRPARIHDSSPRLITIPVPINVAGQKFTYAEAARRARFGARTQVYLSAAGAWAFEYTDGGTWFVAPGSVTKLKGRYADLVADIEQREAKALTLTAPRKPDDKLLQHLQKAGYSDPSATDPNAVATVPAEALLSVLEQAEALGYTIEAGTWKPLAQ